MKKFFGALALALAVLAGGNANADTVLYSTDFDVADGPISSIGWTNHSGTVDDLLITGGAAVVQHGTPSEDSHIVFAEQTTGVIQGTFDVVVNDDTPISGTDFEYFAHFMPDGTFNFRARLDLVESATGDYTFGISSGSSTAEATLGSAFTYGDVVNVVVDFDLDTGTASVTAGGETVTGSDNGAIAIDSFALRQSDSGNNESITVDNLTITAVMAIPEPTSAVLFGLAGLGLCVVRRRS